MGEILSKVNTLFDSWLTADEINLLGMEIAML